MTKDRDLIRTVISAALQTLGLVKSNVVVADIVECRSRKRPRLNLDPPRGDPAEVPRYQILWFR